MASEGDDPDEEAADLQCQMIDAVNALMHDHGYSKEDILAILKATALGG